MGRWGGGSGLDKAGDSDRRSDVRVEGRGRGGRWE